MLVYTTTVRQFKEDVVNGEIADKVQQKVKEKLKINHNNDSEYRSWENSLRCMHLVLDGVNDDVNVAIEYELPLTSKRVDFIITGLDKDNKEKVIIIELKQWEKATKTSRTDIVTTFVGSANRDVVHPSYQAYSYAKTIENFNEEFQKNNIEIYPCAFLHNYKEEYREELDNHLYKDIIDKCPIFLKKDSSKLKEFINNIIVSSDNGSILNKIENGRVRPSKSLQDSLSSMLKGNEEFVMLDEQKVVFETVSKLLEKALRKNEKYTVIIEGGPGTGKSVIAINLLSRLTSLSHNVNYVSKNAAPRSVYFSKLKKERHTNSYINNLFKGSGSYINKSINSLDCLIVDEAHRLNAKSGFYGNEGENQIKEVINSSRVSVFFIDEDQIVTTKDIGSVDLIKHYAKELNSTVFHSNSTNLTSQFRCKGSDIYISFIDNLLNIRESSCKTLENCTYEFKLFDNASDLREELREKNKINNKSRMLAGYCYQWVSKNNKDLNDIVLDDFSAQWNFSGTSTWAIDEESFDQVGCIHTSQGLEFDYVGVIIGKDIFYKDGMIQTSPENRARSDASLFGYKKLPISLIDRIIKNTYKTLLTRGQKGCFVYCEDEGLREYIRSLMK